MSDFLDIVLDLGYDYGAAGGPDAFDTSLISIGSGKIAIQARSRPMGEWSIGSRNISEAHKQTLLNFWHSVRGRAHRFRYLDWVDFQATNEALALDGTATTQLIKTYGGFGNDYVANIVLPRAGTITVQTNTGAGWVTRAPGVDYTLSNPGGLITWLGSPPNPAGGALARWTGQFHKLARFGVDRLTAQFLAYESRPGGAQAIFSLGALTVRESLEPL